MIKSYNNNKLELWEVHLTILENKLLLDRFDSEEEVNDYLQINNNISLLED